MAHFTVKQEFNSAYSTMPTRQKRNTVWLNDTNMILP
jgi:hypothetical protein